MKRKRNSITSTGELLCIAILTACLVGFLPSCSPSPTGAVRISFLAQRTALRDAMKVLEESGCPQSSRESFQKAVEKYFTSDFEFDFSKFPKPENGFYHFKSCAELIAALPHRLCETQHGYEINCFDTVILLAGNGISSSLKPHESAGPFLVSSSTNHETILVANTTHEAFVRHWSTWYVEATEPFIPSSLRDTRINLNASFFRYYGLPALTNEKTLKENVMNALRESWQSQDLKFPRNMEIVLCHQANPSKLLFNTDHAGLLIQRGNGCTYFEKAGGSGPFVRLDFDNRADLIPWLTAMYEMYKGSRDGYTNFFVTFNDTNIEQLGVKTK